MMGGQVALLGGLAARLYQVQVVEGGRYATLAEENRISARLIAPPRGRMLDRFGTVVAGNRLNWRALLVAEQTSRCDARRSTTFARIVPLADYERARIERELHRHRRFIPIMVREFLTWDEMAAIEVNAPDLPGILVDVGTTRIYPYGEQLAHVVGYVAPPAEADVADDPDLALPGIRVGRAGLEKEHDLDLRGTAGAVQLEVNALGRVIRELDRQEGMPGEELGLTIDAGLQQTVLRRLGDESASAVVLDCRNGEVLAMGTNPSFDPSLFNAGVSQAQWAEWTRDKRTPLLNRAIAGVYAPGSTFKMAVAMAGLEARIITPGDRRALSRLSRPRQRAVPLLAQGRPRLARSARRDQEQLRRVFLRDRQARRHRPHRGDGAPLRSRHRTGDRPARRAPGLHADARMAHRPGPSLEPRRHGRRRHRPGLHPGHAAAACRPMPRASPPGARWSRT